MKTIAITFGKKPSLKGIEVSLWAKELLAKTTYSKKKEALNLVFLTPADLGFTTYPTTTELYARAKEQGYDLCPAEAGPQLAGTLEEAGWMYIAMEPITDSDGGPSVFTVGRRGDGEQWLCAHWASPGDEWGLGGRIVFQMSKNNLLDRIFEKVDKTDTCWNWTGATRTGYGRVRKGKRGEGVLTAHKVVYETLIGKVPTGLVLDHLCRNRVCVNPEYLEVVTYKENLKRGCEAKESFCKFLDFDILVFVSVFSVLIFSDLVKCVEVLEGKVDVILGVFKNI